MGRMTRDHTREDLWGETEKEPYKQMKEFPRRV